MVGLFYRYHSMLLIRKCSKGDCQCDAKSSAEEVTPLRQLGVVSISVKAESIDCIHPMNAHGITFQDGHVLPTWDWMVEPAHEKLERLASVKR